MDAKKVKRIIAKLRESCLFPADDHHANCNTRNNPPGECDCYARSDWARHKLFDELEAELER